MSRPKMSKIVHFSGTACFMVCAGYMLVLSLLQAGKSWWVILSLSGYSVLLAFLLTSLYLFAVFRSVARSQKTKAEHPLTGSFYYFAFYDLTPFLGVLAGAVGAIGIGNLSHCIQAVVVGCLCVTFAVWIIVDPVLGLCEMLLPSSRKQRRNRLDERKAQKQKHLLAAKLLFKDIKEMEVSEKKRCTYALKPYAEKLASLAAEHYLKPEDKETEAVDIGINAWKMGGINCMTLLHCLAMEIYQRKYSKAMTVDYISIWWDGIGSWRSRHIFDKQVS